MGKFVGLEGDQFKGAGMFMSSCWKYMVYVSTGVSVEAHFGPLSHGWGPNDSSGKAQLVLFIATLGEKEEAHPKSLLREWD